MIWCLQIDHVEVGGSCHHTEHHIFRVPKRYALINVDELVQKVIDQSAVYDGFIFVSSMHTTAAVFIADQSTGILHDIARIFTDLAPYSTDQWEHHKTADPNTDNADGAIKSLLMHHGVQIPITKGKADIGPDQYAFYAEFDGKKEKRIIMKVTGLKKVEGGGGAGGGAEQKQPVGGTAPGQTQAVGGAAASGEKKAFRSYD
jgi:secondary thiamine-phosphate synthase enzyme